MKPIIFAALLLLTITAFAAPREISYKQFAVCEGNDIQATIYWIAHSSHDGLIVVEKGNETPQFSTTKINNTIDGHGKRIHSNFFKMNFDQYDEDNTRTSLTYKDTKYPIKCYVQW